MCVPMGGHLKKCINKNVSFFTNTDRLQTQDYHLEIISIIKYINFICNLNTRSPRFIN